jgi:arylformamidase
MRAYDNSLLAEAFMSKKIYPGFLFLCIFLTMAGCRIEPGYYPTVPSDFIKETVQYKTVDGVDPNLLSLDIYHYGRTVPDSPVVLWVHGGGWRIGDKSNNPNNKLHLCSSLGYIFVSVNYRLSPTTNDMDPGRVMYPVHEEDVADAVKWVFNNIGKYGGNSDKIVLIGHSAGAHLVSLVFLPSRGIPLNVIQGVASIDTEGYDVTSKASTGNEIYLNAFGTNPAIWAEASPINQLVQGTNYPRFFIAKRGSTQRIAYSDAFIEVLQSAGVSVTQVLGNQYSHGGINKAIGAPNETIITEPLKLFLQDCFK